MAPHSLRSRPPQGERRLPRQIRDREILASAIEDAAHYPGGHAVALFAPATEAEVAEVMRVSPSVLAIGAQSSLTGGATPMGDALVSTARLKALEPIGAAAIRAQAGVTIAELDRALAAIGCYYPPAPTFTGAFVGGTVSTNAAGAATFKYGTTRRWVDSVTIVLANGDVLDVVRGETRAHRDGYFELELSDRTIRVPVPGYRMPEVPKLAAGYFAAPGMDLIDLFIGSEGTLGLITEATLRVMPARPAFCLALVTFADEARALSFVGRLRAEAAATWRTGAPGGIDVSAIEHMDGRCLELLRDDGVDRRAGLSIDNAARMALLITIELAAGYTAAQAYDDIAAASGDAHRPLGRFCTLLSEYGVLDTVQIAAPGETSSAERLVAAREAVPAAVNQRVAQMKQRIGTRIEKVAADVIVPFDRVGELLSFCRTAFRARGLDGAVWGHLSDGNLHPNVIPHSEDDIARGKEAVLEIGREAIRLGGAPMAEHGVGRNPVKQRLLQDLYGASGIDAMRRVKEAFDPDWKLAPGVLFPRRTEEASPRQPAR